MLFLGEDLDRAEHRDRQDDGEEDEGHESAASRKVRVPARNHQRHEQRERDEDGGRPREPELLIRRQREQHGRNLSNPTRRRYLLGRRTDASPEATSRGEGEALFSRDQWRQRSMHAAPTSKSATPGEPFSLSSSPLGSTTSFGTSSSTGSFGISAE